MDEVDLQIIQALQKDGRTPFTAVAKKIGVSEATVRTRYASMIENGLVNTAPIVDPYVLGFQAPAIILVKVEAGRIDEVAKKILALPEVSYLVMTLGEYDLIIEAYGRDVPHLTNFVANDLQGIDGVVSTQTSVVAKLYKLSYLWSPTLVDIQET